ncbi:phosphoglycerate mutase-like protein [Gonapodya prolifera JEL478]|uniref:Phosphoglycerate mutase-like protein n=1 Tax=Gonapodya prolifera (strain JEL478) TaxID=1344416 RepID=A0A139AMX8_GONPJ|nr:phosphoglycerate mutase-like protein [Gonapodya prolifera JEL478]|eukprot:KXS17863.1 phosphoglycerate mutase-like protein [Gonapodya prolifera JEL478]
MPSSFSLLVIRHAESVANIRGHIAGSSDSPLTNHGAAQALLLARHISSSYPPLDLIVTSDLVRARETARAIADRQNASCELLEERRAREKDFGPREGKSLWEGAATAHQDPSGVHEGEGSQEETFDQVRARSRAVLKMLLDRGFGGDEERDRDNDGPRHIALVSHGIFISRLLREIASASLSSAFLLSSLLPASSRPNGLSTSNTGVWRFNITLAGGCAPNPESPAGVAYKVEVLERNSTTHLKGLKRQGVGSEKVDTSQKKLDLFFQKKDPSSTVVGRNFAQDEEGKAFKRQRTSS